MTFPTPRYQISAVVYCPTIDRTTATLSCPDCHGTREWWAVSPAGERHTIACPRCTDQYARSGRDQLPSLQVTRYVPRVSRLTIGSITVRTHPHYNDDHVEYMANETGVGSGSIYRESDLYPNEFAALEAATVDANLKNVEVDANPKVTVARAFSGLTFTTAALAALKNGVFNSWQAFRSLGYEIESLLPDDPRRDTEEQHQFREALERYGKYGGTYLPIERHPIDAVIEAFEMKGGGRSTRLHEAIAALKSVAGFADHPESPPCTCEFVSTPSATCPRHGSGESP
jgi:hypothetical protein